MLSIVEDTEPSVSPRTERVSNAVDRDATQLYLREIEFSPLLTPEEEVELAKRIKQNDPVLRS